MSDVTIVIPNYNGISFLDACLRSVSELIEVSAEIIVVDNGSTDGSREFVKTHFPQCQLVCLDRNYGFCRAVNEGIRRANSPYVILLNNDTEVKPDFAAKLLEGIRKDKKRFSCAARMLKYQDHNLLDDAGDFYCALGWSLARGKDKPASRYEKEEQFFPPVQARQFTERRWWRSWVDLMKPILPIWRTWIFPGERRSMAMKTGTFQKQRCFTWEVRPVVPAIIHSK
jgi:GT2 family glycosyltransferase